MALRKHSQLLPSVFQTDRNQKFLNATLDQLNSEPNNVRINQYIGRKSSGSFSKGDSYVTESTARRQNYQLEPAVVYRNSAGEVQSVNGVVNALNSIAFNNADTTNMHKLVSQQYYNYEGWVDIDKLINYGEYFWLPAGPDSVQVFNSVVDILCLDSFEGILYLLIIRGNSMKIFFNFIEFRCPSSRCC